MVEPASTSERFTAGTKGVEVREDAVPSRRHHGSNVGARTLEMRPRAAPPALDERPLRVR